MREVRVSKELLLGTIARWSSQDPWVTILKVRADRYGFDVLYAPDDAEPRWRGFDAGDTIEVKEES